METKTVSSKDTGSSSEVASLNDRRRQEGLQDQEGAWRRSEAWFGPCPGGKDTTTLQGPSLLRQQRQLIGAILECQPALSESLACQENHKIKFLWYAISWFLKNSGN